MIRSTTIIYEVLRRYDLSPLSYMLCDLIYKYTSANGYCEKKQVELCEELNISPRTSTKYIQDLLEKGFIDNVGTKNHPKYKAGEQWFNLVVKDGTEKITLDYQKVCEDVINYINERYKRKYNPRTYEARFKYILSKKFDGKQITGGLMVQVFDYCKSTWSESYQSSVTPEVIFGKKFIDKYLIMYNEHLSNKQQQTDRKRIAII